MLLWFKLIGVLVAYASRVLRWLIDPFRISKSDVHFADVSGWSDSGRVHKLDYISGSSYWIMSIGADLRMCGRRVPFTDDEIFYRREKGANVFQIINTLRLTGAFSRSKLGLRLDRPR